MSALPEDLHKQSQALDTQTNADRRAAPRFALLIQAAKLISENGETLCVVHDASQDGIRVRHFGHIPDGKALNFELANGEVFPVQFAWLDETFAGLKFPEGVDLERLVKLAQGDLPKRQLRINTLIEGVVGINTIEHCMTVRNISQQGACIDCREELEIGQRITIETETLWPIRARVRWRIATIYGLVFDEPLSCEHLAEIVADARRHP
jgi:hypothetical protein